MGEELVDGFLTAARAWNATRGGRAVPSPSSVAKCSRRNWFVAHGQPSDHVWDNGESAISSATGTASEPFITEIVAHMGYRILFRQGDAERELRPEELEAIGANGGQFDNVLDKDGRIVLLEIKRKGIYDVKSLVRNTLKGLDDASALLDAVPDEYTQLQMLMHALRAGRFPDMAEALYVVCNWDRGAWTSECFRFGRPAKWLTELGGTTRPSGVWVGRIPYNERSARASALRAEMQRGWIADESAAASVPKDPTQRGDGFSWDAFPCTYCEFRNACKRAG